MGKLEKGMIYAFVGGVITVIGMIAGHYLTMYILQAKASRLLDTLRTRYPYKFELWCMGYRSALREIFYDEP
jgi:hypothetical protein